MRTWLWYVDDGGIAEFPEEKANEYYGFVYIITNIKTQKFYIGKKAFTHNKKKKLTKKEIAEHTGVGRKPTTRVDTVDSGWKLYCGSSKELLADVKLHGEKYFERIILHLAKNKKQLSFFELQEQITYRVLFSDNCYNDNIAGKYFRKDFA